MNLILVIYCVGGLASFSVWFSFFVRDFTTPLTHLNSWKMLLLMTILWPIVVPISWIELMFKNKTTKPSLNTSLPLNPLPLGYLLKKAGLISESQLIQVLDVQQTAHNYMRIGEIIASYGWLKQETIDFFADSLIKIRIQPQQPIGQYLKSAKLLNDLQIEMILNEQHQTNLRFGEIAIKKGWVQPQTINFILDYLQHKSSVFLS
ncbi:hypothetical protein [Lyngbya sp. PCC 8106]|uniref:hypothetical protein n=1 Tax=Lyngbya sp. (strain PCC 8106) TaxID=313612 RepID=UPI0002E45B3E|nr:hypothetical protein [Lyngbya sp. PCC 8106]